MPSYFLTARLAARRMVANRLLSDGLAVGEPTYALMT